MRTTGVTVKDGDDENDNVVNTGLSFKRLNLQAALAAVPQAPTLAPIAAQTLAPGGTLSITLAGSDPNHDPLSYSARIVNDPAEAYQLKQLLGLTYPGSYYQNIRDANEKWITGTGQLWYCILPNGEFRRWAGTMADTLTPANLLGLFDPAYYADPSKIWNAASAQFPPISMTAPSNVLTIRETQPWVGSFVVEAAVTDGTAFARQRFTVTVQNIQNSPPVLASIANLTMPHSQGKLSLLLSATDADGDALTYAARVVPLGTQTPPVAVTVQGNQLTLDPAISFVGTFTVEATVSDGTASATRTFTVTVTNTAPVLAAIADQAIAGTQTLVTLTLAASDADGDAVSFSARILTPDAAAYQLDQKLGLAQYSGSYYTNMWGAQEKWLVGANGLWYGLLPDGKLYRWTGSFTTTVQPANLVAALDPLFYSEPRLLWDAKPPTAPPISVAVQGNKLALQRSAGLLGVYLVEVTASDGAASVKRTFLLRLN
jgi:Bacterial Ig domain